MKTSTLWIAFLTAIARREIAGEYLETPRHKRHYQRRVRQCARLEKAIARKIGEMEQGQKTAVKVAAVVWVNDEPSHDDYFRAMCTGCGHLVISHGDDICGVKTDSGKPCQCREFELPF